MRIRTSIIVLAMLAWLPAAALADTQAELQARFKQRYPHLQELKAAGVVGETAAGFIDFVNGKEVAAEKDFINAENDDRRKLYQLIADKEGTTADQVAKTNAKRRFDKAKAGEWLKGEDGAWKKKA